MTSSLLELLIAAKNSVMLKISIPLMSCPVEELQPRRSCQNIGVWFFLNNNYINNKVLDISSYCSFQIISTRVGEDHEDGDDEARLWSMGVVLRRRGRRDGEEDAAPSWPPSSRLTYPAPSLVSHLASKR